MTNTQKQRSTKQVVGPCRRTSVQSSGSVESTESVKRGPKSIKTSPNKSSAQSQEETYRVCKLHCAGPTFLFIKLNVNLQRVKRVCFTCRQLWKSETRSGSGAGRQSRLQRDFLNRSRTCRLEPARKRTCKVWPYTPQTGEGM